MLNLTLFDKFYYINYYFAWFHKVVNGTLRCSGYLSSFHANAAPLAGVFQTKVKYLHLVCQICVCCYFCRFYSANVYELRKKVS